MIRPGLEPRAAAVGIQRPTAWAMVWPWTRRLQTFQQINLNKFNDISNEKKNKFNLWAFNLQARFKEHIMFIGLGSPELSPVVRFL
jgi:hypothetical protein